MKAMSFIFLIIMFSTILTTKSYAGEISFTSKKFKKMCIKECKSKSVDPEISSEIINKYIKRILELFNKIQSSCQSSWNDNCETMQEELKLIEKHILNAACPQTMKELKCLPSEAGMYCSDY